MKYIPARMILGAVAVGALLLVLPLLGQSPPGKEKADTGVKTALPAQPKTASGKYRIEGIRLQSGVSREEVAHYFNSLADEGWEYVEKVAQEPQVNSTWFLFKRAQKATGATTATPSSPDKELISRKTADILRLEAELAARRAELERLQNTKR